MAVGIGGGIDDSVGPGTDVLQWARDRLRVQTGGDVTPFSEVEECLLPLQGLDPTGEVHALLGLAQFLQEKSHESRWQSGRGVPNRPR